MKLYGAQVSQEYIQYKDNKKRHIRYPRSEKYPKEAIQQEHWGLMTYYHLQTLYSNVVLTKEK